MTIIEFDWNNGDVKEWICALDKEAAITFYANHIGDSEEQITENYKVSEVPKKEWGNMILVDPEESEPDDDEDYNEDEYSSGCKIVSSFKEYMESATVTDIIATTEF